MNEMGKINPQTGSNPRYAIYFTPARNHPLTRAAVEWLGRDAFENAPVGRLGTVQEEMTAQPRRYGFHATLKAPFRLKEGERVEQLEKALSEFAHSVPPSPLGPLQIGQLGSFFALVSVEPNKDVTALAASIVTRFDAFRAPLADADVARRLRSGLDDIETAHLDNWGYPYVFDRFRFHMTLTGSIAPEARSQTQELLKERFAAPAAEKLEIDALTLFEEASPGADFVVRARFPLGGVA